MALPLLLFLGLSDFLDDAAFFIPNVYYKENGKKLSPASVKQIIGGCSDFIRELALHSEPFVLADIDISDGNKQFALKFQLK